MEEPEELPPTSPLGGQGQDWDLGELLGDRAVLHPQNRRGISGDLTYRCSTAGVIFSEPQGTRQGGTGFQARGDQPGTGAACGSSQSRLSQLCISVIPLLTPPPPPPAPTCLGPGQQTPAIPLYPTALPSSHFLMEGRFHSSRQALNQECLQGGWWSTPMSPCQGIRCSGYL